MFFRLYILGGTEDLLPFFRNLIKTNHCAGFSNFFQQFIGKETLLTGHGLKMLVNHQKTFTVHNIFLHDYGKIRLTAGSAVGNHGDRTRGLDRGQGRIATSRVIIILRVIGGKRTLTFSQLNRSFFRLLPDKTHDSSRSFPALLRTVWKLHLDEHVVHAHDSEADFSGFLGHLGNFRNRKPVAVYDIIQKTDSQFDSTAQPLKINLTLTYILSQVNGTQVTGLIRQQPLLTTGIGGLEFP